MRYRSHVGRDAKGNRQGWFLPTIAVAVQVEELQGSGGRGDTGDSSDRGDRGGGGEKTKDEWVPAGCRGCQQPGAGGDGTGRMTRVLKSALVIAER